MVPSNPDLVTLKRKPFYATLVTTPILCLFLSNFMIYHNFHFFTFCSIDTLDTILVIIIVSLILLIIIIVIITSIIFSSICLNQQIISITRFEKMILFHHFFHHFFSFSVPILWLRIRKQDFPYFNL